MSICPSCRKPVDSRLTRCPWDGTQLGAVPLDPLLGTALGGRYLLRKSIGERERMRLYTAEENTSGRPVLATVITGRSTSESAFENFRARAELGRSLEHPSCTVVRDYGLLSDGRAYIIEEGEVWHQLGQELAVKGGRLPLSRALDLAIQLVEGLDHLHGKGLYNTGISSWTLRLVFDAQGALKLQIPTAEVIGRVLDEEEADRAEPAAGLAADLEAAAWVLAEMLLGQFEGLPSIDPRAFGLEEEASLKLQTILHRALRLTDDGFGSAWEMRRELESLTGRSRLGRYTLLHRIAVGGMGEIYLARAEGIEGLDINRFCVIKTIRTSLVQSAEFVERFLAEARVLASLSHGNIVPVHDVGKVGSVFYIAMEYVAGKDLRKILTRAAKEKKRMSVPLALFIAKELANGLAYAHRAKVQGMGGLVHRDVSPHNTVVSYDGEVKLIDFGLAKAGAELRTSADEVVMGKVCYISPEQARAETVDQRTDIYSAGLVLFEMLTGEPFFNQPTIEEVLDHVGDPADEPPSRRVAGIPPEVDRICMRAMAPRREDRYRSAAALRDDLTAELARLAPRTNPEEVGNFVRSLFAVERKDEETLISDLSMTIPPVAGSARAVDPATIATEAGAPDRGSSEALSLLGRTPIAIQLATWEEAAGDHPASPPELASTDPAAGLASAGPSPRAPAKLVAPPPAPTPRQGTTPTPTPVTPGPLVGSRTDLVSYQPRPLWRSPLLILLAVSVIGGGGLAGGFWLSSVRTRQAREAERAALRNMANWSRSVGMSQQAQRQAAGSGAGTSARSQSRPDDSRRRPPRSKVKPARSAESCLLAVRGGDGLELVIDGNAVGGRLPLTESLPISPGVHQILVRGAGLAPYRQRVTCNAGDLLTVRLRLRAD